MSQFILPVAAIHTGTLPHVEKFFFIAVGAFFAYVNYLRHS